MECPLPPAVSSCAVVVFLVCGVVFRSDADVRSLLGCVRLVRLVGLPNSSFFGVFDGT